MDIGSRNKYPAGKLSNFTGFSFEFDGIPCASMEGLLQAFKFENVNAQKITCSLTGFPAKKKGSGRNKQWKQHQTLFWNGDIYHRHSDEYQNLLDRAYTALYTNGGFRKALIAAGAKTVFTHSIGNNNASDTVLTEREFCSRLQRLKDLGKLT